MRILITPFQTLLTEYFVNKENDISSNRNIIYKSINDLTLFVDNYIKYNKQYNTSQSDIDVASVSVIFRLNVGTISSVSFSRFLLLLFVHIIGACMVYFSLLT
jgi:hypothetical protein